MLFAKDVMKSNPITLPPEMTIADAIASLHSRGISGAPVCEEDGKLVGVVSDYGLLPVLYATELREEPISECMTTEVISTTEEEPLTEVVFKFIMHRIRRLPVVRHGKVVGIISRCDLLAHVVDLEDAGQLLPGPVLPDGEIGGWHAAHI